MSSTKLKMDKVPVSIHKNRKYIRSGMYTINEYLRDKNKAMSTGVWVDNREEKLIIEFIALQSKCFEAKIIHGPPDLLNVFTDVDWNVLDYACKTGDGIVGTSPLRIEACFIWKIKGQLKLSFA